ncbi:unnamed protein product [Meganyctiphanes norvegica]|uniref:WD repeat-containing protein 34 n=1 Tax=Meganyctiphanes norvegica TaxID=48144 RepID=A0AAV2QF84_MEGNR
MFNNYSGDPASFQSSWKTDQQLSTGSTQTEEVKIADNSCQVVNLVESGMQTEKEEETNYGPAEYNEGSLLSFLRKIGPKVEEELKRQSHSTVFNGYNALEDAHSSGVKLMHTLRWPSLENNLVVTCIDWSCTGSGVGIAYGSSHHDDWCDHKGAIAVWNINRNDFDPNRPERVIDVSSCVLSLAFHPTNPAIFAMGTFNGEVLIYDLSNAEEVTPFSSGECGSTVTSLTWVESPTGEPAVARAPHALVATTTQGHILVWGLQITKQLLTLRYGFAIQGQDAPKTGRIRMDESASIGLSCISFNSEDPTLFVVGAEGGSIFLCSSLSRIPAGIEFGGMSLSRCVTSTMASHTGRVLDVQCSPHHRNGILTAGSDNQIRLYTLLQPNKPVREIYSEEAVTSARWSPSRPTVLAAGHNTGQVILFEFGAKSNKQILKLPTVEKPSAITDVVFNKKNMNLLAGGDQLGRVMIWQLPSEAVSPLPTELASLTNALQAHDNL